MQKEEIFFDSRDGASKIRAMRWIPDEAPKCIVQLVHGMAEHIERYDEFACFLASKGILVTGEDMLGHGKSVTDGKYGYFCKKDPATVVVRDIHKLKKLTQEQYPGIPYFIFGHSMGSFILRNYLFMYGKGIDGAIVAGTGMLPKVVVNALKAVVSIVCLFGGEAKPSKFIDNMAFGTYLKKIDNPRTSSDWLTKADEVVDEYIKDPECGFIFTGNGFKTMADLLLRLNKTSNVAKMPVTLPVLIVSGKDDPVGDYGAGPKRVYDQFVAEGMQKVSLKLYDNDRHELLNETDRLTVFNDLYEWIENELKH